MYVSASEVFILGFAVGAVVGAMALVIASVVYAKKGEIKQSKESKGE